MYRLCKRSIALENERAGTDDNIREDIRVVGQKGNEPEGIL